MLGGTLQQLIDAVSNAWIDRDHCIQYMAAVPLIFGRLSAADYEDASLPTLASTLCG